jgi:hypothetical protein
MTTNSSTQSTNPLPEDLAAGLTFLHLDAAACLAGLAPDLGDLVWTDPTAHALVSQLVVDLIGTGIPITYGRRPAGGVLLRVGAAGVVVRWSTHPARALAASESELKDIELLLNFALDDVLCVLGWETRAIGQEGAYVVTGRRASAPAKGGLS